MLASAPIHNAVAFLTGIRSPAKSNSAKLRIGANLNPVFQRQDENRRSRVSDSSLRVLEWDKLCDAVSAFAGTSLGHQASKKQLRSVDQTYQESLWLLSETNAAVEIQKYSNETMDFTAIDTLLVRSAINRATRASTVDGQEAMSVAVLLQFSEALQTTIRAAIRENAEMQKRFTPLAELILDWFTNKSLVRSILQVVNEDGSIKDSASPRLRQARSRVMDLESKLCQLMNAIIAKENIRTEALEASNIDGRWCIKSGTGLPTNFNGLLLSRAATFEVSRTIIKGILGVVNARNEASHHAFRKHIFFDIAGGSGTGNVIEPVSAVPLNDELLEAKASVAAAEFEILSDITQKMKMDLDGMESLLKSVIELDVVNARASYGLSLGGTCPDLLLLDDKSARSSSEGIPSENTSLNPSSSSEKQWKFCLPKAYHPLLLEQHRRNLQESRKNVTNATSDFRRRKMYGEIISQQEVTENIRMLREKVTQLEQASPVPVDFVIEKYTRVLLITGPNTGGKTICLKAVGLAAIMAKAGVYVLCSEPAQIPWFDSVFADIGDDQSLSQSLSTFSGHLRQISDIQANSTSQSLVLLDEIGAGTNPLEGAALGMSILESFANAGALLTVATTHHGELKTLKYSNEGFENACMEFDEVNLKPTYKILWGVPGRSNAINIAERLGLPKTIVHEARKLYGAASAEIDEVIFDLEKYKQDVEEYVREAQRFLMVSKDRHKKLMYVQRKLTEHSSDQRYRTTQIITELASKARSTLHRKLQQYRADTSLPPKPVNNVLTVETKGTKIEEAKQSARVEKRKLPIVGDTIQVSSLGTKATVLKVEPSKEEIVVQAGMLKLKLKFSDIKI